MEFKNKINWMNRNNTEKEFVSISRNCIYISKALRKRMGLPKRIKLGLDKENNVVALKPSFLPSNTYKVVDSGSLGTSMFNGHDRKRYPAEIVDNMIIVDID